MNATLRGLLVLGIIVAFVGSCLFLSFGLLPAINSAVAVPVIMVPGEPYDPELPVESFRWTNTLTAMALASLLVVAFMVLGWNTSQGWTRQVPTRFQSWVELVGGFMYGLSKQVAGSNARLIFPLVATIFVFLLAVNWMKLLPGVESVGVLHCAEEGFSSYPMVQIGSGAYQLYVDTPLNAGTSTTHDDYKHCKDYKKHPERKPSSERITEVTTEMSAAEDALIAELDAAGVTGAARQTRIDALRAEYVAQLYDNAKFALSAEQLREGAVPYGFVITPYVRGGSTDLNLTIGLALISVVSIQIFGVLKQGPGYFSKFVNLPALGNLGKRPLGAVDFIVGIIEIISEIGKIVSLAFRLFGNMFAGGILLIVMSFLVALIVPGIFIGLEVIITTVQALVFAVLTLVFSAQAMEGHHGGDEHGDGHH